MLKLSGIARSTYYYHIKQQDKDKYAGEKADIIEIFDKNKGVYGYRRGKRTGYSVEFSPEYSGGLLERGPFCFAENVRRITYGRCDGA